MTLLRHFYFIKGRLIIQTRMPRSIKNFLEYAINLLCLCWRFLHLAIDLTKKIVLSIELRPCLCAVIFNFSYLLDNFIKYFIFFISRNISGGVRLYDYPDRLSLFNFRGRRLLLSLNFVWFFDPEDLFYFVFESIPKRTQLFRSIFSLF